MSELIQKYDDRATIRWKLLTGASALALAAYVSSATMARAEDADRPLVWIELGGQMEAMQGLSAPFTAPFMTAITPTPGPYKNGSFIQNQRPPRFAFGEEGKISFQPEDSDWIFAAGVRYGRSHGNRHVHHQTQVAPYQLTFGTSHFTFTKYAAPFADTKAPFSEKHAIVDFSAGKDIGLGMFGRGGSSTLSAGVRFAQFASRSSVDIHARPVLTPHFGFFPSLPKYFSWNQYAMTGHASRDFKGLGPSLSWNASAALLGDAEHGELMLDWGVNAAALFGRQKAKTDHSTQTHHRSNYGYPIIHQTANSTARTRSVTVPNIGGFAGLSYRYTDAKINLGYRYDAFLNAMDTGIDTAKKSNLSFNGPFASISIGLGD